MAGYQKNKWAIYDNDIPKHEQPDAFITKDKLENIESGIKNAVTDFKIGTVSKGTEVYCEIVADENDPSVKRINLVIPKEVSWSFSSIELSDNSVAPTGSTLNDIILDASGNIFTIIDNGNGIYILNKRLNIKGAIGDIGPQGDPGKDGNPGQDGKDGKDGQDGNKWVYIENNIFDGEEAPDGVSVDDFVFDSKNDVFKVLDNLRLKKIFNLRGADGKDGEKGKDGADGKDGENGKDGEDGKEYYLEVGNVTIGGEAHAEISDHKLHLVLPTGPVGDRGPQGIQGEVGPPGPAGESTYDIWKALGNTGDAADFIKDITGPAVAVIDSLDSTSTTEALSANMGRELKNNRLTTLDEILANEEEGIFVDALAVKELYFNLIEMINNLK